MSTEHFYTAVIPTIVTGLFSILLFWMGQRAKKKTKNSKNKLASIVKVFGTGTEGPGSSSLMLVLGLKQLIDFCAANDEHDVLQSASVLMLRLNETKKLLDADDITSAQYASRELKIWQECSVLIQILFTNMR